MSEEWVAGLISIRLGTVCREYYRGISVQFGMKAKTRWIVLVAAVAGFIAGGGYLLVLNSRTHLLEERLTRVEAALNAEKGKVAATLALPEGLGQQRLLEERLARLEAALIAKKSKGTSTFALPEDLAQQQVLPLIRGPQAWPFGGPPDSLERRVEKIEQELTPHLEMLPLARPEAPRLTR